MVPVKKKGFCVLLYCLLVVSNIYAADWQANWIGGPFLGVFLHSVGGVAHGTFYAPLKKVKKWSWESGWLVQGLIAWVVVPWPVAVCCRTNPIEAF